MTLTAPHEDSRAQKLLVVVGIVVLAFNLRPAAVSVGPVLEEVSASLRMGSAATSLLTSLPVLSFATLGALAPRIARTVGLHRSTLLALVLVVAGLWLRARVDDPAVFLALSFLALAGMAVANVLLPSLVKLHFPHRIGLMTSLYSTALAVGLTGASVLTVPIAETGADLDWRRGLGVWALTALVAVVPWIALARHDARAEPSEASIGAAAVARTRVGWVMAGFFGLQSLQAYSIFGWMATIYRDAGSSPHEAGLLLGLVTGISIPLSLLIPWLTARVERKGLLLTVIMACYPVGYVGLLVAPSAGAPVWALAIGAGTCAFPFVLTLIALKAATPAGTAALSAFTQSVGYLVAVLGPFGVGVLHASSGGWTLPVVVLLLLCVPQYVLGLVASRAGQVEDELRHHPPATARG